MNGLKILRAALFYGAAAVAATSASASTMVNVTWGDRNASVGTVRSSGSGADFYNYSNYVANVPFALELGTVYAFVHEQTGTGALSLGMITTGTNMDVGDCRAPADSDKCRSYLAGWMTGAPLDAETTVKDGGRNYYGDGDRPDEKWAQGANGRYYVSTWTNDTSGFVLDGLSVGNSLMFGFWELRNFDKLAFVSGGAGAFAMTEFAIGDDLPKLWINIEESGAQRMSAQDKQLSPVPLPAGAVLLLSALGLSGFAARRSRRG